MVTLLVSGTAFFTLVEKWSILDAFYFSVTTLTTVGFGDPAPTTALGKIFTVVYIFVGLGVIGGFINVLGEAYFRQAEERRVPVKSRKARVKTRWPAHLPQIHEPRSLSTGVRGRLVLGSSLQHYA